MTALTGISPTAEEVKQARTQATLTQAAAAKLIYVSLAAWQRWEQGDRNMHPAYWELFLVKTGLNQSMSG